MITYQKEEWSDVLDEMKEIFKIQWKEVGLNALSVHGRPLDPNWEVYDTIDKAGGIYVYTARSATSGNLIGHCMFFVFAHLHSKDLIVAENDFIYLLKEYRKGRTGIKLIKFAVGELKKVAEIIFFSTNVHASFLPILKRLDFKLTEHRAMWEV